MKVHTVIYNHKYGYDIAVYPSEELAYKGACSLIPENIRDYDHKQKDCNKLINLVNSKKYEDAFALWSNLMEEGNRGDSINIEESLVYSEVKDIEPMDKI